MEDYVRIISRAQRLNNYFVATDVINTKKNIFSLYFHIGLDRQEENYRNNSLHVHFTSYCYYLSGNFNIR